MRIGIFGSAHDPLTLAVAAAAERQGLGVAVVESQGLNQGVPHRFDGARFWYGDDPLDDVAGWYLRYIMAPLPPAFSDADQFYLYGDWFIEYSRRRERFGLQLSWLHWLHRAGVPLLNPPEVGGVVQLKPLQLAVATEQGFEIPKTLITNDPEAVRRFAQDVGDVVYKPLLGGGLCEALDEAAMSRLHRLSASPVIFQERVTGDNLRLTLVGGELVSAVRIPAATLDYRADPAYERGEVQYEPVVVHEELARRVAELVSACGLVFSGVDLIHTADDRFVFLEANSSPVYLDIERKLGHDISGAIVGFLLRASQEPEWFRHKRPQPSKSFVGYGLPFAPGVTVGSD